MSGEDDSKIDQKINKEMLKDVGITGEDLSNVFDTFDKCRKTINFYFENAHGSGEERAEIVLLSSRSEKLYLKFIMLFCIMDDLTLEYRKKVLLNEKLSVKDQIVEFNKRYAEAKNDFNGLLEATQKFIDETSKNAPF
ncbi:MAG: hypothetical protein J4432_03210 [DPANN group archaeon]|nr:hypothetical protein [DPANN group archaeon]